MNRPMYSWDQVRSQIRQFRTNLQSIYSMQVLAIVKDFTVHENNLYFLSNNSNSLDTTPARNLQLYRIQLDQLNELENLTIKEKSAKEYLSVIQNIPILKRNTVFTKYTTLNETEPYFRHSHLQGVSSFQIIDDVFLLLFQNNIYLSKGNKIPKLISFKPIETSHSTPTETEVQNRIDPKLGGTMNNLIAFIKNNDIWVTDSEGNECQVTFSSLNTMDPTLKSGVAEYMMQEEFHRFTGYYWSPQKKGRERIVYLETSELEVEQVLISKSTPNETESIRYPRAGQPNAKSELKILEFSIGPEGKPIDIVHKRLWGEHDIRKQFPWMEYIVRLGWLPDGESIWVQLLSRDQKRTVVLKIESSQFTVENNLEPSQTQVLWEETNKAWINITDVYYFLKSSRKDKVEFIWSSEKEEGYRHLFLVSKAKGKASKVQQLTKGEWCCIDRPLYVDEMKKRVYFTARMDTPLESHFYMISYIQPTQPQLLTRLGFSHTVYMNSPDYFVDCFSTLHDPQVIVVQRLDHEKIELDRIGLLMQVTVRRQLETPPSPPSYSILNLPLQSNFFPPIVSKTKENIELDGEIFSFKTTDGIELFGLLYKPRCYEKGQSYPTLLHIYGGPKTQLIANEFKFPRLVRYLMSVYFGFAVVVIDSRGSSDRGLKFESHIQNRLGTVELKDQLEGLDFLYNTKWGAPEGQDRKSVIDINRVAITGWSYGGYLSLMALAQYSNRFKMAIAGAPVTQWELYDAAYTERYMGLPDQNQNQYKASNILTYIKQFPNEENRLLIAHGLIDENVHFKNTEILVSELVKENKPHYLQVYPSEKHGLRHASVNEHFEILMFYWLTNYL